MRAVVQRVSSASVHVNGQIVAEIARGLLVLLGVESLDGQTDVKYIADKLAGLRVFDDEQGNMNLSVQQVGGAVLVVSQFTLLGDVRRGKRPSFTAAMEPDQANELYQQCCQRIEQLGLPVQRGQFRADMQVGLVNDGPVTILLDSRKTF
ncbi:MAG: D-tyrosyl-tRNA(Tyr) deacylase [Planctomycetales bacterium]|nr:D-tyrosyl-tRNA(Tyr) deacylase [Planctomycetales bacterium]